MKSIKMTTGLVRLSYAHLFQPDEDLSGHEKYSASLIIPKGSNTVSIYKDHVKTLLADPEAKAILKNLSGVDDGLRDGDEKRPDDDAYAKAYYVNAKANTDHRPKILDRDRNEIVDPEEVYSGCYVQAVLTLYVYNTSGNKGIGVSLNAIRKIKDGERLAGTVVSESDWDDSLLGDVDELM